MTIPETDWKPRLTGLLDELTRTGRLRDREWRAAFERTPRHVFVPTVITGADSRTLRGEVPGDHQDWLDLVYSDTSLVVQNREHPSARVAGRALLVPTSSSTMPSLMARMLEVLDVADGHRVLEIGTGTGYNAAVLCHRLGSANVTTVDIDRGLADSARRRLAALGCTPAVVAADGTAGVPEHAPYDRIIATAAVPEIPMAWIEQLAPGGKILANLRGELFGSSLCLLTRDDAEEAIGPVLPLGGHFMWLRPDVDSPVRDLTGVDDVSSGRRQARTSTTLNPGPIVEDDSFRFFLQLHLHGIRGFFPARVHDPNSGTEREGFALTASDGSRAEIFANPDQDGCHLVVHRGPRRLWDGVEAAYRSWTHLGRPAPDRFGVVANRTTQFVWLDTDESWYSWPLPLV